jgi:hypothetical protein
MERELEETMKAERGRMKENSEHRIQESEGRFKSVFY